MNKKSNFGWSELIIGLLMTVLGIITFIKPENILSGAIIVYGIIITIMGIDDIIVFNRLEKDDIKEIAARMLKTLTKRLAEMDITLEFTDAAISAIADAGFDNVYGARPLRRAIQRKIEDPLSELMLQKKVSDGDKCTVDFKDDKFTFNGEVPEE